MTGWAVVIPVKRWAKAKSRVGGLRSADRRELAAALAHDVILTVCATAEVARCVVVGPDEVVRELRHRAGYGAVLGVEEEQGTSADPLNSALRHGRDAALSAGHRQIAMIMADMPALNVSGLTAFLQQIPTTCAAVVRDRNRTGTTILAGRNGEAVRPAFGPDSANRHIACGALDLTSSCDPGLRIDVDTWADLVAAQRFAGPALRRWFDDRRRRTAPLLLPDMLDAGRAVEPS